jgi:hypothetical protein
MGGHPTEQVCGLQGWMRLSAGRVCGLRPSQHHTSSLFIRLQDKRARFYPDPVLKYCPNGECVNFQIEKELPDVRLDIRSGCRGGQEERRKHKRKAEPVRGCLSV